MLRSNRKIKKVMNEFKKDTLHTGSKKGPLVKDKDQAIAIALSEARKNKYEKKLTHRRRVL